MMSLAASALIALAVFLIAWAARQSLSSRLTRFVEQTGTSWSGILAGTPALPSKSMQAFVAIRAVVLFLVAPFIAIFGSFLLGLVVALGAAFLPGLILASRRERYHQQIAEQLPNAVSLLVASVRTQGSLVPAIRDVANKTDGAVAREFGALWRSIDIYGLDVATALDRARQRVPVEGFTMVCSALIVSLQKGGDLLTTLESISSSTRTLSELREKIKTETAGLRNEARFAFFSAPAFILLARLLDDQAWVILFGTPGGNLVLVIALAMQVLAWFRIRGILRTAI